jgi:biopolymer transport protein ExbB
MIGTFQVITYHGAGDPRLLAGGISEALITTQAGLIIAVPALLLHNYLSTKADKIASDMEKNAVKLINSLPE